MKPRSRPLLEIKTSVKQMTKAPSNINYGYLAEEYDGVGQYALITLSRGAVGSAYKARVASGDFQSGRTFPEGTPVSLHSHRGKLEILSLGANHKPAAIGGSQIAFGSTSTDSGPISVLEGEVLLVWYSPTSATMLLNGGTFAASGGTDSTGFAFINGPGIYTLTDTTDTNLRYHWIVVSGAGGAHTGG